MARTGWVGGRGGTSTSTSQFVRVARAGLDMGQRHAVKSQQPSNRIDMAHHTAPQHIATQNTPVQPSPAVRTCTCASPSPVQPRQKVSSTDRVCALVPIAVAVAGGVG